MEFRQKHGVFLARLQPVHNSHIEIIRIGCEENDVMHVFVGSADKCDEIRNPLDIYLRKRFLKEAIVEAIPEELQSKIEIHELNDWTSEDDLGAIKEWGYYLYYNIVSKTSSHVFTLYYSDDPKILESWFTERLRDRITIRYIDRKDLCGGLSATKVREAIESKDKEFIKLNCPGCIRLNMESIRLHMQKISNNFKD